MTRRTPTGLALASLALLALVGGGALAAEHRVAGILDLRLLASDADRVWLDGGLDKARLGDEDEPVELGAALLDYRGRWLPTLDARLVVAAYDDVDETIDLTEAFLDYHPVPRSAWRWRVRGGLFYPPASLENTSTAWTSPYTLSFSAINSWLGEEIRALGAEVDLRRLARLAGSPHELGFTAALFRANDPAGALVAWRGWALDDRQTGYFERLPLAELPAFGPEGSFPPQEAFEEPFVELDGRTGYYAGAGWDYLDRSRLRLLHYDNLGDPTVVEDGQWAWRTRFDHLGWHFVPTRDTDLIFQALDGYTLMEGYAGPLVEIDFWSAFLLASRAWGPHRASLRFDAFGATDRDGLADDPNQEHGHAWTAAYFYTLELRSTEARGGWRFGVELLSVDSDRPARRLFGEPAAQRETTAQLVVQWRWR